MQSIDTPRDLAAFAREYGLRPDWHEPDEQGITARVVGTPFDFDNAIGTRQYGQRFGENHQELCVIFTQENRGDVAIVNLANLCAWAAEYGRTVTE